ncbi:protein kinase, partial [Cystoisospora suis]
MKEKQLSPAPKIASPCRSSLSSCLGLSLLFFLCFLFIFSSSSLGIDEEKLLDESLLLSLPEELVQGGEEKKIEKTSPSSFSFLGLPKASSREEIEEDQRDNKKKKKRKREESSPPSFARWREDGREDGSFSGGYAFDTRTCTRIFLFPQASQYVTSSSSLSSFREDPPREKAGHLDETRVDVEERVATSQERRRRRGLSLRRRDEEEEEEKEEKEREQEEKGIRGEEEDLERSRLTQGIVTYFPYYEEETSTGERLLREKMHELYALVESWRYTFGIAERRDHSARDDRLLPSPYRLSRLSPSSLSSSPQKDEDSAFSSLEKTSISVSDLLIIADARYGHESSRFLQFPSVCEALRPGDGYLLERMKLRSRMHTATLLLQDLQDKSFPRYSSSSSPLNRCDESSSSSFSSHRGRGNEDSKQKKDEKIEGDRSSLSTSSSSLEKRDKTKKERGNDQSTETETGERTKKKEKEKEGMHAIPVIPSPCKSKSLQGGLKDEKDSKEEKAGVTSMEKRFSLQGRKTVSFFSRKRRERLAKRISRSWLLNPNRCFVLFAYPHATFTADNRWDKGGGEEENEEEEGEEGDITNLEEEPKRSDRGEKKKEDVHLNRWVSSQLDLAGKELQALESLSEPVVASILRSYDRILRLPLGYIITPHLLSSSLFSGETKQSLFTEKGENKDESPRETDKRTEKEKGTNQESTQKDEEEEEKEKKKKEKKRAKDRSLSGNSEEWLTANVDSLCTHSQAASQILQEYGRFFGLLDEKHEKGIDSLEKKEEEEKKKNRLVLPSIGNVWYGSPHAIVRLARLSFLIVDFLALHDPIFSLVFAKGRRRRKDTNQALLKHFFFSSSSPLFSSSSQVDWRPDCLLSYGLSLAAASLLSTPLSNSSLSHLPLLHLQSRLSLDELVQFTSERSLRLKDVPYLALRLISPSSSFFFRMNGSQHPSLSSSSSAEREGNDTIQTATTKKKKRQEEEERRQHPLDISSSSSSSSFSAAERLLEKLYRDVEENGHGSRSFSEVQRALELLKARSEAERERRKDHDTTEKEENKQEIPGEKERKEKEKEKERDETGVAGYAKRMYIHGVQRYSQKLNYL